MKKQTYIWLVSLIATTGLWQTCTNGDQAATENAVELSGDIDIDQVSRQIGEDPQNAELYALRSELFYEKNSFDQAIQDISLALTIDSVNLGYHHLLADIYLDYFRSRLALQTMERAVAIAPDHIPSLLKLSEIQLFLKMNQASLVTINKVLEQDPQNALAFFFMGKNFEELGDINRAINAFQEASEIDPEMLDAWIKLGQLHASINGSLAEAFFDNAIEVDSSSTIALNAKAEYRWSQDDPLGALALYKMAIRKAPMDEKSYFNAGLVYLELDSITKAYDHFNMAIENSPLYVGAYYYRGYASEVSGNKEAAKRDYEHALRLSPSYERAQEGLARVR
jgi:tetratricopeptide (TPR) repeat protein